MNRNDIGLSITNPIRTMKRAVDAPLIGAHMSIAGSFLNAVRAAERYNCTALQIFTKNQRQWRARPISTDEALAFQRAAVAAGIRSVVAHATYLINLASPDSTVFDRSLATFIAELRRSELLGATHLVFHPGAHKGEGEDAGLDRVAEAIKAAIYETRGLKVKLTIEITAGQGTSLGYRFEHIARLMEKVGVDERLAVCFDTCHAFAAGYDIRTEKAYRSTMRLFDEIIGLKWLQVFHLNDSKGGLGSKVDRHIHLGHGEIGETAFRLITQDERFADVPKIIETPKENDWDARNLGLLMKFWREKYGGGE